MTYLTKTTRCRVTPEEAQRRIREASNGEIELLEWGGRTTDRSKFKNHQNSAEFECELHSLLTRLRAGVDLSTIGMRSLPKVTPPKRDLENDLRLWLEENLPHIEIVKFSGQYNTKSVFKRVDTGVVFSLEVNRLKDKFRRELIIAPTKEETYQRTMKTRMERGLSYSINGRPARDLASELGISYAAFQSALKYKGLDYALSITPAQSSLETSVEAVLEDLGVSYITNSKFEDTRYRPDFILPDHKLIIECDGLYWHSDAMNKDKNYHFLKRLAYLERGYTPVFFRQDEIWHKLDVIRSMIERRCGLLSKRVFARKCILENGQESLRTFLDKNHLMSRGKGFCVGLSYDGELVAVIQGIDKSGTCYISRFCTQPGTSVVGGFSKLLNNLTKEFGTTKVETFVDLRYGTGEYLEKLGFVLANSPKPSFKWTNGKEVFHRMKFPGDGGYDKGLYKIWDCGQALYAKTLSPTAI